MLKKLRDIRWNLVVYLVLFITAVAALVVLLGVVNKKDSQQQCVDVKIFIEGKESFIDQADISKMIQQYHGNLVGKELNLIPLQKIEKNLEKLPYVSNVNVYADMDGVVQVKIAQREVMMRVINQLGREYYVDKQGLKIPTTLKYVPRVLVASGQIKEGYTSSLDTIESKVLRDLCKVVDFVNQDELWSNQVVQLYVNGDNDIEIIPRIGDQLLVIGNADSLENKFHLLTMFYKEIVPKVGANAYEKVNVKYAGQIICQKRGDWVFEGDKKENISNTL